MCCPSLCFQLRCQLTELEELWRKEKLDLTAEIAALKKTVEENERLRLSRLLRSNAERESLHDRQLRTLRVSAVVVASIFRENCSPAV